MESRFSKYETSGKATATHIANVNSFINNLHDKGLDLIEKEIQDLSDRIDAGNAPVIFSNKKKLLIDLGKCIESVYETYHYNREDAELLN